MGDSDALKETCENMLGQLNKVGETFEDAPLDNPAILQKTVRVLFYGQKMMVQMLKVLIEKLPAEPE